MSEHMTQTRLGSSFKAPSVRARIYAFVSIYFEAGMSGEEALQDLLIETSGANALPDAVELNTLLFKVCKELERGRTCGDALARGFVSISPEEAVILRCLEKVPAHAAKARMLERLSTITAAMMPRTSIR